jgi:hypothetical protein
MKKAEARAGRAKGPRKPCCLISEVLEEAGLDREHARALRRQVLQGVILLCQWQLERMQAAQAEDGGDEGGPQPGRARRVDLG